MPLVLAGLAATLAGCAGTASRPREPVYTDCLFRQTLDDWSPLDDEHFLIFGPGRHDAFLARLAFPNPDLMHRIAVAIVDDDRNGLICGGVTDGLVFGPGSTMPGKHNIVSLRKIDRTQSEQLLALSKAGDRDALKAALAATANPSPLPPPASAH